MPTSCGAEETERSADIYDRKMCMLVYMVSYLWYRQAHGDTSEQKQVTVDPIHQFVDAAIGVDVSCGFGVLQYLHSVSTHGIDHHLLKNSDRKD